MVGLLPRSYMFVTAQEGVILRVNYANLLATTTPPTALPVTLNVRQLQRGGAAAKAALPPWIKLLTKYDTQARLQGICTLPELRSTVQTDGIRDVPAEWLQE